LEEILSSKNQKKSKIIQAKSYPRQSFANQLARTRISEILILMTSMLLGVGRKPEKPPKRNGTKNKMTHMTRTPIRRSCMRLRKLVTWRRSLNSDLREQVIGQEWTMSREWQIIVNGKTPNWLTLESSGWLEFKRMKTMTSKESC
jgi:hypothetical protein